MRSVISVANGDVLPLCGSALRTPVNFKSPASRVLAAALMLAVSPATLALAQTAEPTQLDPLVVEAQKKKKKAAAAKKSAAPKQAVAAPAPPVAQPPPQPISDSIPDGASTPGGNPYANPNAPYMVERSASGKLTEPLLNTPKTITAVPKEVLQEKQVRDLPNYAGRERTSKSLLAR